MTTVKLTPKNSERHAFEVALQAAQLHQYGFAAWQMPESNERNICIGETIDVENNSFPEHQGFLFHPYDDNASGHFIKADLSITSIDNNLVFSGADQLVDAVNNYSKKGTAYYTNQSPVAVDIEKVEFLEYVSQSIEAIDSGAFQKVVPARSGKVTLTDSFDLFKNFDRLCRAYPNAFVSVVSIPTHGTWMGATPEILISVNKENFQTVSLAGTQKHDPNQSLSEVAWTQKEIEEQALVSRYIINCFKKIRLREFDEVGPRTVVAGNLIHLKTSFKVDKEISNSVELGNTMLELLHPTSAICGMPKSSAADFIKKHENGNREFYSGYLGPINFDKETHLFVNLRCMQLLKNAAILYAGAGVTADSNPEKEWLETAMKMNTLLNIIKL